MRRFLLLLLLLVAVGEAQAQDLEPSRAERAGLMITGLGGAVGAALGAQAVLGRSASSVDEGSPAGVALTAMAYTGGMALGTALAGEVLGLDAPLGTVGVDAALGVPAGLAVGALTGAVVAGVVYLPTHDIAYNVWPAVLGVVAGSAAAVNVSALVAARRVETRADVDLAPAAFRSPTGEAGTGLTLRIGL